MKMVQSILSFFVITALVFPVGVSAEANTNATKRAEEAKARMEERQAKVETKMGERTVKMEERQANLAAKKEELQEKRQEAFCARFTEKTGNKTERMDDRAGNVSDRVMNRGERRTDRRDNRDDTLSEKRDNQDDRRSDLYTKLEGRADTDEEKAAVAEFKATVDKAVEDRRSAIDKAISDFRTGVDASVDTRNSSVKDTHSAFKQAVDAAVAQAKSDCESGKSPEEVRSAYEAAMKAARENRNEDKQVIDKIGDDIKKLAETRKAAVEKALADFKATVEAAKEKLKSVMGSDSEEPAKAE